MKDVALALPLIRNLLIEQQKLLAEEKGFYECAKRQSKFQEVRLAKIKEGVEKVEKTIDNIANVLEILFKEDNNVRSY